MDQADGAPRGRKPIAAPHVPLALMCVYCLPTVAIAGGLIAAGGTRLGLLIPAITVGAMIGGMMFLGRIEKR
jgi:hypothetical protein